MEQAFYIFQGFSDVNFDQEIFQKLMRTGKYIAYNIKCNSNERIQNYLFAKGEISNGCYIIRFTKLHFMS